jgi:eukaryotic-like serine/threonine-protein kinase
LTPRDERLKSTVGGKYRIVRFLAEGGMGAVYEAHHLVVKRRFAVKFLRADLVRRRDVLLRFKREAEATGSLEGENIAAVLDFGITTDGAPYIVMEYLDGIDLGALLAQLGPLPVARAADLVIQACRGMQEAHSAGVVHRDLKPQNLFVCRRGDGSDLLKIVDFGVAKLLLGDPTSQVTRTGSMVGTPSYMSPEQARGETEIDARADVHALGVILYELLSRRTPHRGDSFNAVIHQIATQPPMPLRCEGRELPPELEEVVLHALASDPAARQASAGQLASELLPFARREVWPDPTKGRSRLSFGDDVTLPTELANVEKARTFSGSRLATSDNPPVPALRRAQLISSVGLLLAVLFGALWLATRSSPSLEPTATAATATHRDDAPANARTPSVPSLTPVAAPSWTPPSPSVSIQAGSRTNGRPGGRPPKNAPPTPVAARHAVSDEVAASFDTKNPYE